MKTLSFVAGAMLILAILPFPYAYYTLLRWAITIFAILVAYNFYKQDKSSWTWVFGGIAVLFNPIAPVYLSKGVWVILDFIGACLFSISAFSKRKLKHV